jgi:hypothetical protein
MPRELLTLLGVPPGAAPNILAGEFNWRGAWNAGVFYDVHDVSARDGTTYLCQVPHINEEPPDAAFWDVFVQGGAEGPQGEQGEPGTVTSGTPVNAVAAAGTLTLTGSVADGETVTIGADVYEFDTNSSVGGGNLAVDVSGGATAPAAVTALVATITASGTEPVSAVDGAGDTVVVTADVAGTAAESIVVATDAGNGSWGEGVTALDGGVDGTVGAQGTVLVDTDYLYVAIAENTVADANWRRIALETLA